jgi:hypothetical protein
LRTPVAIHSTAPSTLIVPQSRAKSIKLWH